MNEVENYFAYRSKKGLVSRLKKLPYKVDEEVYWDRLNYEIQVIVEMGYVGYFLLVEDFISWAKSQDILVGPGRGSGAGSLVCFAHRITNIDPIPHGLIFERFLNPARISMPDLDIDFPQLRRGEVIQYVMDKYGHDKVAQICTFGTFQGKAAIHSMTKTLGYPRALGDKLTKLYPDPVHGKSVGLKDAIEQTEALRAFYNSDCPEGNVLKWALEAEGRISSFGTHAAGVVISNTPIEETIPLALSKDGNIVTQWEMNNVEEAGLIKFDFLGLKNLDVIAQTIKMVKEQKGIDIDIENLSFDHSKVYQNLRKGDNIGIFQLESSSGMRDLLIKIRPDSIEDLTALVAMYRPGPLGSEQMQVYLNWRNGGADPTYHHDDLRPILRNTGGWIVYQEQVLEIAKHLAGYSLAEADLLRRAVGKKKEKEMAEHYDKFREGLISNGYSSSLAETLWHEIEAFAAYGFNKSHAMAYAVIAYWCAYLKTFHPKEFMAAALTFDTGNLDQMIVYLQECRKMNVDVLPPCINTSQLNFTVNDAGIVFGLSAIKNLGEKPASHIIEVRKDGPFQDIFDFAQRVDLGIINRTKIESLVRAGAFDGLSGQTRSTLLQAMESILLYKKLFGAYESKLETCYKKEEAVLERLTAIERGDLSDTGKSLKPLKAPVKPEPPVKPQYQPEPELPKQILLQNEKELTGFFISGHPLENFRKLIDSSYSTISSLRIEKPSKIVLIGVLSEVKDKQTKNKQNMAFVKIEDLTGVLEGVVWPRAHSAVQNSLVVNVPVKITGDVKYIEAEPDEDSVADEVIPTISINKIELLNSIKEEDKDIDIVIPLEISKIISIKKILNRNRGDKGLASIKLQSQSGLYFDTRIKMGVANDRTVREEIRQLN